MEKTADPGVFIEGRGEADGVPYVIYRSTLGERWIIRGRCIACGECEVGAVNPNLRWTGLPVGEAGACVDTTFGERPDIPVRPELPRKMTFCTLSGEYL